MVKSGKNSIQGEGSGAPVIRIGLLQWAKTNLFNGVLNSILTIVTLVLLYKVVPPFVRWAFIDSLWFSSAEQCRAGSACAG